MFMSLNLFFAAADEGMLTSTLRQFGVNWPLFLSQLASFCIVAFLLHKFAYKKILTVLAERRARIEEGLANADRIKAELARTEASRREVLEHANQQANKLIEEARAAAARVQEQETQKAIAAADHAKMLADLKREIGRLVVETTGRVTGKILTPDDQKRLAEETSRQLAA